MRRPGITTAAMATLVVMAAATQAAGEAAGRYTMSPADGGGFVRLDTQTGQMALCNRKDSQWACQDMAEPGRGLSDEIERLRGENKQLRSEIRKMEDIMLGDKGRSGDQRAERPGGKLELPSEQDIDNAMSYVQRMLRKFKDKLKEFETDSKGTPL